MLLRHISSYFLLQSAQWFSLLNCECHYVLSCCKRYWQLTDCQVDPIDIDCSFQSAFVVLPKVEHEMIPTSPSMILPQIMNHHIVKLILIVLFIFTPVHVAGRSLALCFILWIVVVGGGGGIRFTFVIKNQASTLQWFLCNIPQLVALVTYGGTIVISVILLAVPAVTSMPFSFICFECKWQRSFHHQCSRYGCTVAGR